MLTRVIVSICLHMFVAGHFIIYLFDGFNCTLLHQIFCVRVHAIAFNQLSLVFLCCSNAVHANKNDWNQKHQPKKKPQAIFAQNATNTNYKSIAIDFIVHRGPTIPTLASMQEPVAATRYRQSKERSSVDLRGDDRGKLFICFTSHFAFFFSLFIWFRPYLALQFCRI